MVAESDTPKRRWLRRRRRSGPGWFAQMRQLFSVTRQHDPSIVWWMLGVAVAIIAVAVGIGFAFGHPVYAGLLGVPMALLAAIVVLGRRAEAAMFAQAEGQPGAVSFALQMIRRGWTVEKEPIAVDTKTRDMVFRAVGKPGVVLIGEGSLARVSKLLEKESKRHQRVLSGVPVHTMSVGRDEGQVPLNKLNGQLRRLPKALTTDQLSQVLGRLKALGGAAIPVPKGIDPMRMRPDRRAMRGR